MRPDVEVLREMLQEAEEEAVAFEALAARAWALDHDEQAEVYVQAGATRQARARILTDEIARREPTGLIVGPVLDAAPERIIQPSELRRLLTVHENRKPA